MASRLLRQPLVAPRRGLALLLAVALLAPLPEVAASPLPIEDGVLLPAGPDADSVLGVRALGNAEGLPQLTVLALAQDGLGYVYAGTQAGLSRWDGRRFETLPLPGGQVDWVTHLLADARGRLWVGSDNHGLFLLEGETLRAVRDEGGAELGSIEAMARVAGADDQLWIGTPSGLFRCSEAGCRAVPDSAELQVAEILDDRGPAGPCLWVGTNLDGLFRFDHDGQGGLRRSADVIDRAEGLPNGAVRALLRFPSDDPLAPLWIGSGRGLARRDDRAITRFLADPHGPLGVVLGLAEVRGERAPPQLLAALFGGGLGQLQADGSWRRYGFAQGLPDPYLYSVLVTGEGAAETIWLGSAGRGVLRIEPGRWFSYDERHGLPQRAVVAVGELPWPDDQPRIWAGTLGGSVYLQAGRWQPLLPPPYTDWVVHEALRSPDGRRWFATQRGVLMQQGDRWRLFDADSAGLPATSAERLLWRGGADGELWVGTGHGLARIRDEQLSPALPQIAGFGGDHAEAVRAMLALPADHGALPRVLFGLGSGPRLFDAAGLHELPADCAAIGETLSLLRGTDASLWLGGRHGLARARESADGWQCRQVRRNDQAVRSVYRLLEDARGRIYVFSYDGVWRIERPADPDPTAGGTTRYGLEDGLPTLEFNRGGFRAGNGTLWAASNDGLVRFDPDAPVQPPAQPPLRLRVRVGDRPLTAGEALPADHADLLLAPRLLSFRAEHRITYRSRLQGLETGFSAWQRDGDRRFSRLPAGHYQFQVEARDALGQSHGPLRLDFRVDPPWWQQPSVLLLAAALLLGTGLASGRWRSRALARRARELGQLVAERTAALERASHTDPLTGCYNRRYFHQRIGDWLAGDAGRGGLLLMLVDIDHFKAINDSHGHRAGDAVLVAIAERLRSALGTAPRLAEGPAVVRWGGEEFLLVTPARQDDDLAAPAQAVLQAVAAGPVELPEGGAIEVRCSLGYTRCSPPAEGIEQHIDLVIARADQALYRAKEGGRDRAVGALRSAEGLRFESHLRQP